MLERITPDKSDFSIMFLWSDWSLPLHLRNRAKQYRIVVIKKKIILKHVSVTHREHNGVF